MISACALTTLVFISLGITVLTPVILLMLLIRDYTGGKVW